MRETFSENLEGEIKLPRSVVAQHPKLEQLDEHLVLRYRTAFLAARAVLPPATRKQELQSDRDPLHNSRELAHRRNDSSLNHFGSLLHAVQGAAEKFIGSDDLQTCAIHNVCYRRIH